MSELGIVVGCWVGLICNWAGTELGISRSIGVLRAVRPLAALAIIPSFHVVMVGLTKAMFSLTTLLVIFTFFVVVAGLMGMQLLLLPVLFMVQELTVRLGAHTGQGHGSCIRDHYGQSATWATPPNCTTLGSSMLAGWSFCAARSRVWYS